MPKQIKRQTVKLIRYEQRKARKEYLCQICGKGILPGKQYMYYSCMSGNRYLSFFCHIHCDAMLRAWDAKMRERNEETHLVNPLDADEMKADIQKNVCWICVKLRERGTEMCSSEDITGCTNCIQAVIPDWLVGTAFDSVMENSQEK